MMPPEIMHLPLWFPFHLSKISYWSRTVIVPLLVLMALKPAARNPRGVNVRELFRDPPGRCATGSEAPIGPSGPVFSIDRRLLRNIDPFPRPKPRRRGDRKGRALSPSV